VRLPRKPDLLYPAYPLFRPNRTFIVPIVVPAGSGTSFVGAFVTPLKMYLISFCAFPGFSGSICPWNSGMLLLSPDDTVSLTVLLNLVSNMHGKLAPPFFVVWWLISLALAQVGLKRGIGRLPRYLHSHAQYHHPDPDLSECDLPSDCDECRCSCHKWCFFSVWVDSTGVLVGLSLRPGDEQWRATVYGYPSHAKEWHRSLYIDGMLYYQLTVCVRDSDMCRLGPHCTRH
jgi:hypothetical protein